MRRRLWSVRPSVEDARGPDSVRRASGRREGLVVEADRYEERRVRAVEGETRRVVCLRRGGWAVAIGVFLLEETLIVEVFQRSIAGV